jgi:hypothetical protein
LFAVAAVASASDGLQPALERVVGAVVPGAIAIAGGRTASAGVANVRTGRPLRPQARAPLDEAGPVRLARELA